MAYYFLDETTVVDEPLNPPYADTFTTGRRKAWYTGFAHAIKRRREYHEAGRTDMIPETRPGPDRMYFQVARQVAYDAGWKAGRSAPTRTLTVVE